MSDAKSTAGGLATAACLLALANAGFAPDGWDELASPFARPLGLTPPTGLVPPTADEQFRAARARGVPPKTAREFQRDEVLREFPDVRTYLTADEQAVVFGAGSDEEDHLAAVYVRLAARRKQQSTRPAPTNRTH